jgi:hypothetical protein
MKMLPVSLYLAVAIQVATGAMPPQSREGIEWCDIWISHANETGLPRVLLIGDSIARGYYAEVEKRLAGKAFVARVTTSAFLTDPAILQQIASVLNNNTFEVIHFNNGMHGWQHSENEYQKAFPKFLKAIQMNAPKAKLIWATTTPISGLTNSPPSDPMQASNERIENRNALALKQVQARHIAIDDLNALVKEHPEYYRDSVHFNSQGIAIQAEQVSARIKAFLPPQVSWP